MHLLALLSSSVQSSVQESASKPLNIQIKTGRKRLHMYNCTQELFAWVEHIVV